MALDASDRRLPLFLQIARQIARDIRRGRLPRGTRLPGSRTLAHSLGVHRNTVLSAYRELSAEGWIATEPARGTYVLSEPIEAAPGASNLAATLATATSKPSQAGSDLQVRGRQAPTWSPGEMSMPAAVLRMDGGLPDVSLVPRVALARAYRRALDARHGPKHLDYAKADHPASNNAAPEGAAALGHPRLRAAIARMLATTRGIVATPGELLITRGSQMALYLLARVLCAPGDRVAVEGYGYPPAWQAFALGGLAPVPVPVDAAGLCVDALPWPSCRAVYLTPHHQYPTTVTLSPTRRLALLAAARRHGCAVIEDDYDHEFHYDGRPVLPLKSLEGADHVVYVGTLSKVLAPGLRLGYVVAPRALIDALARYRRLIDHQGDWAVEAAIAELIEDGELARHARRARRRYKAQRDALAEALSAELAGALHWRTPAGGLTLWAQLQSGQPSDAWVARARTRGVAIAPASRFHFQGDLGPAVRIGFARLPGSQARTAAGILASAL